MSEDAVKLPLKISLEIYCLAQEIIFYLLHIEVIFGIQIPSAKLCRDQLAI